MKTQQQRQCSKESNNNDGNNDSSSCCFLNPWVKCKNLWRKIFKTNRNNSNDINNDSKDQNQSNMTIEDIIIDEQLVIRCPNCQRKSIASINNNNNNSIMMKMINRCASMSQLSNRSIQPQQRLQPIIQSSPNTPALLDVVSHSCFDRTSQASLGVVGVSVRRSPSNYCRVATCEKLHIHDLTPKCLETFAPSSTCSSCQNCDRPHIGPNHDQLLMVKSLLKELPLISNSNLSSNHLDSNPNEEPANTYRSTTTSLLMQWPLPEYRPQHSPDHLYRTFGF